MKISAFFTLFAAGSTAAFAPSHDARASTQLKAEVGRRQFAQIAFTTASATAFMPSVASASVRGADYVPKFDDLKQIYMLGVSLDRLAAKIENPDTTEAALTAIRLFNKDINFYPGYARNYISKSVLNNADGDVRVGYVKQACTLIGSTQAILEGGTGMVEKEATDDSVKRIKKAQSLIAKFLAESGVETEETKAFVKAHA